ncbi:AAA family ATPase [Geoglobus acetivorans]|uniref:Methanol dehydrogenase regulatory protein (MoxR) n=1 Tax=Geoglobus acetivorans TaxID=565033 RepID=A0A0A7GDZ8_GEOAI|nr:methanol dehydrogenase regulatory protein (moxR) [Geoglobus acetivorans]
METEVFVKKSEEILEVVSEYFVGKKDVIKRVLAAALSNGNVLFEDFPGLGKTLLAKVFARAIGADYSRIQFTPDLLPSDITGTKILRDGKFVLQKGPIFTHVLLADEINRSPPKTQSALLEAMEERQVTIEGETLRLPEPFFVLATQNPVEQEGTYPLPEAQIDRFLIRLKPGYPESVDDEMEILRRRISWKMDDPIELVKPAVSLQEFREMQMMTENVFVDEKILKYISEIVRATRSHEMVEIGSSPRGGLALLKMARSLALMDGRNYVIPDDVKSVAVDCLAHRIMLKIEYEIEGENQERIVEDVLNSVKVPKGE